MKYNENSFPVEQVVFKDFSGVVSWRSFGGPADDAYRTEEKRKCIELKKIIKKYSKLTISDTIEELYWMDIPFQFFYTKNIMREVYEDESTSLYHKYMWGENQNNMPVFLSMPVEIFFFPEIFQMRTYRMNVLVL